MSSTALFKKHFGDQSAVVDLKHPNMVAFFDELSEECLEEDKNRKNAELNSILNHNSELNSKLNQQ